jgi:hypothetical protein
VSDTHNAIELPAANASCLPLYRREVVMVSPWQIGDSSFALTAYCMTRNVGRKWHPEKAENDPGAWTMDEETYTIEVSGLGDGARFTATDPVTGKAVAVTAKRQGSNGTRSVVWLLTLPLVDYPRLVSVAGG